MEANTLELVDSELDAIYALAASSSSSSRQAVASICAISLLRSLPVERIAEKLIGLSLSDRAEKFLLRIATFQPIGDADLRPLTAEDGPVSSALERVPDFGLDPQAAARGYVLEFWSWVVETGLRSLGKARPEFVSDVVAMSVRSVVGVESFWSSLPGSPRVPTDVELLESARAESAFIQSVLRIDPLSASHANTLILAPLSPVLELVSRVVR